MSTPDEKAQAVAEDAAESSAGGSSSEIRGGADSPAGPIVLFFIVGLVASMIVGWVIFPKLLYSQKTQPVDFNHALHVEEVYDDCQSCHYFREDGSFSGIPKIASCMECHEEVLGDSEEEAKFVENYVAMDREVPWLVYSRQPDCVFFSHAAHVEAGGMDCVTCHGHIGESESTRIYEENRITGYSRDIWGESIAGFKSEPWDRMKMDDCADCHAEEGLGIPRARVENTVAAYVRELVNMVWPNTVTPTRGTSVQTEKDGCFVCHK